MKKWMIITMGLLFAQPVWSGELVLQALMSGQIVQQKVRAGEAVKAGQLLLVIDPAQWQARVAGAKAQVKARQAELENDRLDLAEAEDLYDRTVLSKRALQRAQKKVIVAEAALAQAQAALRRLEAQKKYFYIRAPRPGTIKAVKAPQGATALYGTVLVVLEVQE